MKLGCRPDFNILTFRGCCCEVCTSLLTEKSGVSTKTHIFLGSVGPWPGEFHRSQENLLHRHHWVTGSTVEHKT